MKLRFGARAGKAALESGPWHILGSRVDNLTLPTIQLALLLPPASIDQPYQLDGYPCLVSIPFLTREESELHNIACSGLA
jgi:hypothetical protein